MACIYLLEALGNVKEEGHGMYHALIWHVILLTEGFMAR